MYLAYATMCLIFGTTFLAIKVGLDAGIAPLMFAGTRFLAAGFLVTLCLKLLGHHVCLSKSQIRDAFFVGMTMTTLFFGCLYWGEQHISSGIAALLSATAPMMISIVEWFNGKKEFFATKFMGLGLALLGVSAAVFPTLQSNLSSSSMIAIFLILLSQITYAFGAIRSKKAFLAGLNPLVFNAYQMFFGGLGLLLISMLVEQWQGIHLNQAIIGSWFYLVVLGSMVGHGAYYWLVRATNPLFPSTWSYISPIIAQFVGHWWLQEQMHFVSLLGLVLVLVGVFGASQAEMVHGKLANLHLKVKRNVCLKELR